MKGEPVIHPLFLTATYQFDQTEDLIDVVQNHRGYIYSRWDNPTVVEFEKQLAQLEDYDHAIGFASGMNAITTAIFANVKKGSRIVATREIYGGTFEFLNNMLPNFGIKTTFVHCWNTEKILSEIKQGIDLLYLESPTNPLLRVLDIAPLVEAAHQQGALVFLDSTFASPVNFHPSDYDVDIVLHSVTKYLGGHHDITAGALCCRKDTYHHIWSSRKLLGGIMEPMAAFLAIRGLQTLHLRVERQNKNAVKVAQFLDHHKKVKTVHYPGLPSHPDHAVAKKYLRGYGGMLSFELNADFDQTKLFMDNLKVIKLATSLGGVTSLATQPITNTHVGLSKEDRAKAGVSESLVRFSVGVEDADKLIDDLGQALKKI
jgi:cystathionine beta-lyase/cystathionine gamma-synthase